MVVDIANGEKMFLYFLACTALETEKDPPETISLAGGVTELLGGAGISDVEVCVEAMSEDACSNTDAQGVYQVDVYSDYEHTLLLSHEDYVSGLVFAQVSTEALSLPNVSLVSPSLIEAQLSSIDAHWEAGTGILAFSISNGIFGDGLNIPDVLVSMEPEVGQGPFYSNGLGIPTTDLGQTSSNGGGVFVNVLAGEVSLGFQNLPAGCTLLLGWGNIDKVRVVIAAGRVSFVRLECL